MVLILKDAAVLEEVLFENEYILISLCQETMFQQFSSDIRASFKV